MPGALRVAPVMAIPTVLRELGVDARELLGAFGLSPEFFEDPDNLLPFATMGEIFRRSVQRTRCEHFGALVGLRAGGPDLGTVGYLVQSAPDVRTALRNLAENIHLTDGGAAVALEVDHRFAILSYTIVEGDVQGSDQIVDAAMAIGFNILRALCGDDWKLSALHLAHAAPANVDAFRRIFGVAPTFDADRTALIFPERWLSRPLRTADPTLHRLMAERARELELATGADLVELLRRILKPLVNSPDCSLARAAGQLGMHARTLNRRLADEGTTFRELREAVRLEAACQLLRDTRMPSYQIAEILGYADGTALSRAFRRWAGMPPGKWRKAGRPRAAKAGGG